MAYRRSKPWGFQQPTLGSQIDRNDPLTMGLAMAVVPNAGNVNYVQDLITQKRFTVAGTPAINNLSPTYGQGVRFPSTNDLLTESTIPASTANTALTIFVLARVEDTTAMNRKRAVRFWDTTNGTISAVEFSDGTNNVITGSIQYSSGVFEQAVTGGFAYSANKDYAVVLTWKPGDNVRIYANGILGAVSSNTRSTVLSGNNLSLGGNTSGGGLNLRGTLYCAYMWYRILSLDEIRRVSFDPYTFIQKPRMYFVQPAAGGVTRGLFRNSELAGVGSGGSFFQNPLN